MYSVAPSRAPLPEHLPKSAGRTVAIFCFLALGVLGLVYALPRSNSDLAVIAPPWTARTAAAMTIRRAGGTLSGTGRWSFIALSNTHSAGYIGRLYASGAWLVLDAGALGGCKGL